MERAAAGIGLHVNAHKTEYTCYNQIGDISTVDGTSLKLVNKFAYLGSSVESTEKDIDKRLTKAWTAIDRLSIIWKSDLTDKMKRSFFHSAVVSMLLYGCTTWTLTKRLKKKLDGNYTRMLRAILNKSWRQNPTGHQLYGHLPPITKTIQVRRARHAGHCWRSKGELIIDVLLWTPAYGQAKAGRSARMYIQQLCEDTGCSPEDLPKAMNDREKWRERVRDIYASGMTWWLWWYLKYFYLIEIICNDRRVLSLSLTNKFYQIHGCKFLFLFNNRIIAFLQGFTHFHLILIIFNHFIWLIYRTLKGTATSCQSELCSSAMNGWFLRAQSLMSHYLMRFSAIPRTSLLGRGLTRLPRIHLANQTLHRLRFQCVYVSTWLHKKTLTATLYFFMPLIFFSFFIKQVRFS